MEHKILRGPEPINEKQPEDLDRQEWSLVTIIQWQGSFYFYFRRPAA